MAASIALQLYSLRDKLAQDFEETIRQIAEMGYIGVETAGLYGKNPQEAAQVFRELGLQVCSAHIAPPLGDEKNKVLDTMAALGCSAIIIPWIPAEEFATEDKIKAVCEHLNAANGSLLNLIAARRI